MSFKTFYLEKYYMTIKINKKAPNFKLPSTNGTILELRKVKKKI